MSSLILTVNRKVLLSVVQRVNGAIDSRNDRPVLQHVHLSAAAGRLTATGVGHGMELTCHAACDTIAQEGASAVPAKKLLDVLKALPDEPVTLTQQEGKVQLKQGRRQFYIQTLPAGDFPLSPSVEPLLSLSVDGEALLNSIKSVAFSMAQDHVKHQLNGLMLEISKAHLVAVSMDGFRLSMAKMEIPVAERESQQIIIPRKLVQEWQSHLVPGDVTLSVSQAQLMISQGDMVLRLQRIDGVYPAYRKALPPADQQTVMFSRVELESACIRMKALSHGKTNALRLSFEGTEVALSVSNAERDEASEVVPMLTTLDKPCEIGFNVNYILDVLKALRGDTVIMTLPIAQDATLLYTQENDSARYVIMPIRL